MAQKNKRLLNSTTQRIIDHTTGEITTETTSNVIRLPQEPPYVKMYLDDLCQLMDVPAADRKMLELLLQKLDYQGFITLSPRFRKETATKLGIKDQSFRNILHRLCKSSIIRLHSTNEYEVNPKFFARGEWRHICERRESFEMKVRYSDKGREIITEREEQPSLF
jgi:hypothetical protein